MIRAILTDIEGTTSSIRFVKDVLFPYAAEQMGDFLARHWDDPAVEEQVAAARRDSGETLATPEQAAALMRAWIDEDRKATPLKALQGMIWESGYRNGDYQAHLYPDAARRLRDWHDQGFAWHRAKADELHGMPEFEDLYQQALTLKLTETERVAYALTLDMET